MRRWAMTKLAGCSPILIPCRCEPIVSRNHCQFQEIRNETENSSIIRINPLPVLRRCSYRLEKIWARAVIENPGINS